MAESRVPKTRKNCWARFRGYFKRRSTSSESVANYHRPAATRTDRSESVILTDHEPAILVDRAATDQESHEPQTVYRKLATDHEPATPRRETAVDVSQQTCSEEYLAEIATSIVKWREISPFLGLTEAEEHEILGSAPHSVLEQKIAMLRLWKKKKGKAATYNRLCRAFRKSKQLDLEEEMKEILAESNSASLVDEERLIGVGEHKSGITNRVNDKNAGRPSSPLAHFAINSDPITSYASYLKQLYTSMSHSHTSQQWSHLPRCEFIQLAMIGDEKVRRGGREEEVVRLTQLGKIETILGHKESISLNQLFDKNCDTYPPPPPLSPLSLPSLMVETSQVPLESLDIHSLLQPKPRTILIEGAPGGGKSTLALHICHQWAQGAFWLMRFDVVVIAYLRDEAIQNANTLADILPADTDISELVSLIQASYGYTVLPA